MRNALKLTTLVLIALVLPACAAYDARDTAWDPKPGSSLMDQIPAWDGAADRLCCQHLRDYSQCRPPRNPRC